MKLPGTLHHLKKSLDENGWGAPSELRFDADGNLVAILLAPLAETPRAGARQETGAVRKVSPLAVIGRPPHVDD